MTTKKIDADSLLSDMPEINPAAVATAPEAKPTAPPVASPGERKTPEPAAPSYVAPDVDQKGNPFDPERHIHRIHPKTGVWMPRRRKIAPKPPAAAASEPPPDEPPPNLVSFVAPDPEPEPKPAEPSLVDEYRVAAQAACSIVFTMGMTLGGEEWKPSKDEHATMLEAWATYLRAKGMSDIPPGWALAIAMIGYAGPRITLPKTQTRLQKMRGWIAERVAAFKGWRRGLAASRAIRKSEPREETETKR